MKFGSIGEIPPSTRRRPGASARTASAARRVILVYSFHSGSIWKSQCERLFGSFQNLIASIIGLPPGGPDFVDLRPDRTVDPDLFFGMGEDAEPRAPEHRLGGGPVRYPPVGRIFGVFLFDKVHAGK